jgi:hypothetical protein
LALGRLLRSVPAGKTIVTVLPAAPDSPPVADVVNATVYPARAPTAGDVVTVTAGFDTDESGAALDIAGNAALARSKAAVNKSASSPDPA